ncbi:twin-arginine translocase subunit TatC [Aliiglaciecola sp. 3_MG-2023]|uniref:twin-arginine translocase subunit TatC n=1 Tax=Aliiglaciecola sp. 3_MG-2023 TaxID=3062644 RepID=UPI0026E43E2B|nr:twin-arginine translocase subunit TatC [Aliiglaciecola sp. 3_MG-2023]MDO6692328.1 twin-arginine translocase subunit TatC [Aliiglaciecola sp. 3_MG-2023]
MSDPNSFISHLIELRSRLLKAVLSILVIFVPLAFFAQDLYHLLATPLLNAMPNNSQMIATDVGAPFFAPFKLTLVLSFFLAIPFVLYQVWGFIAPGLYRNEKKLIAPLLLSSTLLFYAGIAFAYFVVFPVIFAFFAGIEISGVAFTTDISSYLTFVLKLFFAFGLAFEIPIAVILMCWVGITDAASLRAKRPYVIVGVFVVGMLLTPPDIISQSLLAVPMWILFEIGIMIGALYSPKADDEDEDEKEEEKNNQEVS